MTTLYRFPYPSFCCTVNQDGRIRLPILPERPSDHVVTGQVADRRGLNEEGAAKAPLTLASDYAAKINVVSVSLEFILMHMSTVVTSN